MDSKRCQSLKHRYKVDRYHLQILIQSCSQFVSNAARRPNSLTERRKTPTGRGRVQLAPSNESAAVKTAWQHPHLSRLSGQPTLAHTNTGVGATKITSIRYHRDNTSLSFFFFCLDDCVPLDFHTHGCWLNEVHRRDVIKWPGKQQKTMFYLFDLIYSRAT